jgi:hypothetical protein
MKALPALSPQQQQAVDQFHAGASEMLDRYVHSVEMDMNRHAIKHGPMPPERFVFDFSRILVAQVRSGELKVEALASMVAVAIQEGVVRKRKGKQ